ncbi:tryptophan synthase subunit alpha [Ruminococcus sp.]|uniref:tryptophan synthase subunit alpha n=1 Tax=Ruminococcus sp. TaxID=41978 RepID=UPI0025F3317E|nr:tryptophan synthase subunit alpha [Ruminococcus sp.]MDD6987973.1 tryptophan synthase subunit alpha [Ruminococcus sp.]MDY6202215.1 tryptophan synthase subunit alpha [Ruminococcus sp.]
MSDIKKAFENGKAFIPFVTAGDPDLETTEKLLIEMSKNGADIIEIGIPFSDPIAEGVVIQEADLRALASGTTTDKIFEMVKRVRSEIKCALAVMTYMNPIFVYGTDKFMQRCSECGISAVIVPDTPFEEKQELAPYCDKHGVELVSLIAPTSHDRIKMIAKEAQGFVYCVSSMGVTGVRSEITTDIGEMVRLVKSVSDTPCAVGFGISTPEQAKKMAESADGVIVGSAIVKIVAKYGKDCIKPVCDYVRSMKEAIS